MKLAGRSIFIKLICLSFLVLLGTNAYARGGSHGHARGGSHGYARGESDLRQDALKQSAFMDQADVKYLGSEYPTNAPQSSKNTTNGPKTTLDLSSRTALAERGHSSQINYVNPNSSYGSNSRDKCTNGHWRDVAYDTKIMSRYKPYDRCVAWAAYQFELPEELLYSIIYVERGDINGRCMTNNNGTEDCGPAQINDVRLGEIKSFDLGKGDMRNNPCRNIWAMGYLVRREIEKANYDIWRGVGNYHYHYSVNQNIHSRYVELVRKAWFKLQETVNDKCLP